MAKRHRRTKAEMAIARAEKAEKIAKKFQAKINKKLDEHPQVLGMRPVDFQVSDPNDRISMNLVSLWDLSKNV